MLIVSQFLIELLFYIYVLENIDLWGQMQRKVDPLLKTSQ